MRGKVTLRLAQVITHAALLAACSGAGPDPRGPGTVQMADLLEELAATVDPMRFEYASSAWLDSMSKVDPPSGLNERLLFHAKFATQLLGSGRFEEAADRYDDVLEEITRNLSRVEPEFGLEVRSLRAVGYFLRAVLENCVRPGATARCLVPIGPDGEYPEPRRSWAAIRAYESLLERAPYDLAARWALNLAYMTVGAYPDSVPPQWLIPPRVFDSEHDVKRFHDIAPDLGLHVRAHAGGSIMDDFDGDGYLDLVVSSWGLLDQLRYFRNNADGSFTERTVEAGLEGIVGGLNIVQTDYNNDGHLDIMVLRGGWVPFGFPNSLLRNNGDGTFEDVTAEAGLLEPYYPTQTATWGDFDNDGWLDVYIGNEAWYGADFPSQLFRNNRDGTFTDVAREVGAQVVAVVKAVASGDIDNDGWLDLYLSRRGEPNVLLRNAGLDDAGQWRFVDVSREAGVQQPIYSFTTWFWDYDNDGRQDIFVSGFRSPLGDVAAEYLGSRQTSELPRLYRNNGDGTFSDVTVTTRLNKIMFTMGGNFGDLDNDGHLDIYVGTGDMDFRAIVPNRMFRSAEGTFFQDVTTSGGFGHMSKGHGVAFGDLDNDGDQDIYAQMGGAHEFDVAHSVLFHNPGHGNHWITLELEGVQSNRPAIGARITVTLETPQGYRDIFRTVTSGGSFGASSLQQEIGLGQATGIRGVTVTWPATGNSYVYDNVTMDRMYRIREGDAVPTPVTLERLQFPSGSGR